MPAISLRTATADDLDLTISITEDAMRVYVEQTWGQWDHAEQRQKHQQNFTPETHQIILVDGAAAGFVAVEDHPTHLWLVKLYLLAIHRNRGIGTQILRGVLERGRELHKPVHLRVLRVNTRAQRLYAAHGFQVVEETAERLFMMWEPAARPHA